MLSRVAAVMAPRTHNRRRVTGSSGRRREGRESERQRPNMSRRVFTSAVLLLFLMMWCGTGVAKAEEPSSFPKFEWKDATEGVTVDSLGVPGLLKVGSDVFAVAEAQCKKDENSFTGIASKLLTLSDEPSKEEFDATQVKTQVLVECSSDDVKAGCRVAVEGSSSPNEKIVDVSRPTAVVNGSDIYMLVGKYCREGVDNCQAGTENIKSGILLVKGELGDGDNKKIDWKTTDGVPCTLGEQQKTLTGLIGGGGSGVKMNDTILFPVEGTKKEDGAEEDEKTVSLIIYSSDTPSCTLSKGMSADGCSDPSVVEWKGKLMMMTACDDGRRRVYESGDKGDSWTEALGTLSRVWGSKHEGNVKGVRSGFITATIKDRDVMLVTLPVYSKGKEKGELRLWLTDNTHIVDIGPVSGEAEDVAASALLYRSGDNNEELIALYEKRKGDEEKPSPGMVSVRLTAQLKRVKDVLATWNEVDERVSSLCSSESAMEDTQTGAACSTTVKITDGLVGFLSSTSTDDKWKDEYLGVNATVNKNEGKVASTENGATFTGAWAEWPVGKQGENQLYHFANHKFTLVATVSIDGVPKGDTTIPLMGAKMDDDKTVLLGLSYNSQNKWQVLSSGTVTEGQSSDWDPETQYQVAIVLQNEKQCSAYVDGKLVGSAQCECENTKDKEISHFYIGGDGGSAGGQEVVPVTVRNVLLYNRPLSSEEIAGLAKNKITIPKLEGPTTLVVDTQLPAVSAPDVEGTVTHSPPSGPRQMKQETLKANVGGGAGGVSGAASVNTTPSSDASPTVATGSGDTVQGDGSPQTSEVSVSSGEDGDTAEGTDAQGEEGINPPAGEVNGTALNSSLGNLSQGNNSDACTVRGSGLPSLLLLLLGLWVFPAL
ncbi:trans-sialidase [Trypanosoma cruzi Dm28c]|uniref:Trans-sialidase n=2 Tax=Trypanosoma cruzi TaxID=5693 RepID=V5B9N7_TRYCR|nr:trans-sialidase [Trypanosoma cruzi Dm28c]PBJ79079.1 trans-sialidase [Trypanosoma cruzi cruzi]PWV01038.1 putative trans-sialidase, Group V [Trypanosoma cruzi]